MEQKYVYKYVLILNIKIQCT